MRGIFQYQERRQTARDREAAEERRARQRRLADQRRRRAYLMLAVIVGVVGILGWRLVYWQVIARETVLAKKPLTQVKSPEEPARGTIRDRNGYLLAVDTSKYSFAVSANLIARPDQLAQEVAPLINEPVDELRDTFRRDDRYIYITGGLPYTVGQTLADYEEPAFIVEPRLERAYPNGPLAAHVLGFVNADGHGYGLEHTFSDLLAGTSPGAALSGTRDPLSGTHSSATGSENVVAGGASNEAAAPVAEEVMLGSRPFAPSRNGVDLILTLDRSIQFMAEQELERAVEMYSAEGGTIIVMEPHTGDVLAIANWPTYNPNDFASTPADYFVNSAVSKQYEPGSVFKAITIASALDSGAISPDLVYDDKGLVEVGGRLIRNWDGGAKGPSTVTEILGYSLNTATAWINTQQGIDRFLAYVEAFGFGAPTGIGLEELPGSVKEPGDGAWSPSDLGTNAFGQGIAVTPIQMITAFTAIVNDGQLMKPRLVRAVIDHGRVEMLPPEPAGQPIQPETARLMQSLLADAVDLGVKRAQIEGYRVGGKTGTAQVPIPGGYHPEDTIASFVGYVPADDPTLLILVKLDVPKNEYQWGSSSAAPTFQRLAGRILTYQNVPVEGGRGPPPRPPPRRWNRSRSAMPTLADVFRGLVGRSAPTDETPTIERFVADSREVSAGDCFVAVPGERTDGHRYIGEALQRGARAVIATRARTPADVPDDVTVVDVAADETEEVLLTPPVLFLTDDSLWAVQKLAAWWRRQATPQMRVVGVTGSVGKTTVKEFTAAVLSQRYRTFKSEGNYNSDIGLPLTLLDMPLDAQRAVLEMAMTRPGEIARLAEIAAPVVGIVTNVGPVHMARLGSIEAIAEAKAELVQALPADGVAVLNADDDLVLAMAEQANCQIVTYGLDEQAMLRATGIESHGLDGISFRFHYQGDTVFARLPLLGRHSVHGALAAAAVGLVEGQSWGEIIGGLKDLSEMELLRIIVVSGVNDSTILDDTYNASPASVLAALNLLDDLNGRKVAVLGDMLELGEYEEEGHKRVARRAAAVADLLVTVGQLGKIIAEEALSSGMPEGTVVAMDTREEAIDFLRERLQPDDMVLVKASRGLRLDKIVSALSVDDG